MTQMTGMAAVRRFHEISNGVELVKSDLVNLGAGEYRVSSDGPVIVVRAVIGDEVVTELRIPRIAAHALACTILSVLSAQPQQESRNLVSSDAANSGASLRFGRL
jgi:hypothetical protein